MTIDPAVLLQLASVVISVVALGTAALASRRKDTETRFGDLERRTSELERSVSAMPDREDLHTLHISVTQMTGEIGKMSAVIGGQKDIMARLETIVSRHEDHLLSEGKR